MADVAFERKKVVSRQEAVHWLAVLSSGFAEGGEVKLPVGAGGVVTLRLPDELHAEFEVEITGDEVEVELEFTWSLRAAD